MEEYIENGAQLGWLIDPIQKKVYVYSPDAEVEELDNPASISGDPLLKGFVLDLKTTSPETPKEFIRPQHPYHLNHLSLPNTFCWSCAEASFGGSSLLSHPTKRSSSSPMKYQQLTLARRMQE